MTIPGTVAAPAVNAAAPARANGLYSSGTRSAAASPATPAKIDYVMGSGNHVRTYLHRTTRGTLIELPLAWYAEKGGSWALNPGFDMSDPPVGGKSATTACSATTRILWFLQTTKRRERSLCLQGNCRRGSTVSDVMVRAETMFEP